MTKPLGASATIILVTGVLFGAAPPAARPEVTVEFRWLERHAVAGLTENKGEPIVCGGADWYAHRTAVLTSKDIATARMSHAHFANADRYAVEFTLKASALKTLAETAGVEGGRHLTVYVNGRRYGTSYFSASNPKRFHAPIAGFMGSKELAEKIVAASRP